MNAMTSTIDTMGNPWGQAARQIGLAGALVVTSLLVSSWERHPSAAPTEQLVRPFLDADAARQPEMLSLSGYVITEERRVREYLASYAEAMKLVAGVAGIIDTIYEKQAIRSLEIDEDADMGRDVMHLTITTELPIDEEFMRKERELFHQIEQLGLAQGLWDVIIIQK